MLSRVAEAIYWLSRQVERAENIARILEVTHNLSLDSDSEVIDTWSPLVEITADHDYFYKHYQTASTETVTQFLAFDTDYPNSMLGSLRMARENARGVRESLSSEAFEQLNNFYQFVNNAAAGGALESTNDFLNTVRQIAIQWTGVLEHTMPRDLGWHFANVGRLIERADKTSRILDVKYFYLLPRSEDVGTAVDHIQWGTLLLAIGAFESYRREYKLVEIEKVIRYFLFHSEFPRSVLFCVDGAKWSLDQIDEHSPTQRSRVARGRIAKLHHRLEKTEVKEVLAGGMHRFIDRLQTELNEIGIAMNQDYFHTLVPA